MDWKVWNRLFVWIAYPVVWSVLVGSSLAFVIWYVGEETIFYTGQSALYHSQLLDSYALFQSSTHAWTSAIINSVKGDSLLYTAPLLPFIAYGGEERVYYIAGICLVFLIPLSVLTALIIRRCLQAYKNQVFFLSIMLTLFSPIVWSPVLEGIPSYSGDLLMMAALYLWLRTHTVHKWWQVVVSGILLGGAIMMHTASSYMALVLVLIFGIDLIHQGIINRHNKPIAQHVWVISGHLVLLGMSFVITALPVWPKFFATLTSYQISLESFARFLAVLAHVNNETGIFLALLAVIGYAMITSGNGINKRAVLIVLASAILPIFLPIETFGYGIILVIILGLVGLMVSLTEVSTLWGSVIALLLLLLIIGNAGYSLSGISPFAINPVVKTLLSPTQEPKKQLDYDEIKRLMSTLRDVSVRGDKIAILSSKNDMDPELIMSAEKSVYGRKRSRLIVENFNQAHSYPVIVVLDSNKTLLNFEKLPPVFNLDLRNSRDGKSRWVAVSIWTKPDISSTVAPF